jgi:two-component system, chemotaxis family, sensor kinase CheA
MRCPRTPMKSREQIEEAQYDRYNPGAPWDDIVDEFVIETRENLDHIALKLDELENLASASELLSGIFRSLHSIKGASGFLAFARVERLSHAGESALAAVREGRLPLTSALVAALREVVDCIREIIETTGTTGREIDGTDAELLCRLSQFQEPDPVEQAVGTKSSKNVLAPPTYNPDATDEDSIKPIGQLLVERAGVSPDAVQAARTLQRQGDLRTLGEILVSNGVVTPAAAREIAEYQQEARATRITESSVRVEVELLDKLVNLTEGLFYSAGRLVESAGSECDCEKGQVIHQTLRVATQLHNVAMNIRVQSFATVEPVLMRLVADLSSLSGKRVRLEIMGRETDVDRVALSAIKDPLLHLVRNAVDHGIEPPQERLSVGKPMEGRITVRAARSADLVIVEVADDGAGIDLESVRAKAAAEGLVTRDTADVISDSDIIRLVFLPGFTTARFVSRISGRGVGMDIVKTKLEKIGGTVELLTQRGRGTTVTLRIPIVRPSLAYFTTD